jgi:eukaryotic-like serine/threonine-protein kinase
MIDVLDVLREKLAPRYAVERLLGVGGMARVYLATERHPHRRVAIKVMDPELSSRLSRERFVREVAVSSRLSHPHIVPVFAADECPFDAEGSGGGGLCYYVMPYVEGESLRQRLLRETRLPLDDALHIAGDVADALNYAHGQGVVHRDVKPENILLSGGHALVTDFGVARAMSAAGGATLTAEGQPIGSPAYMSPEQLAGSGTVDHRADVYSLGCVLYEMLVGEPPLLDIEATSTRDRRSLYAAVRGQGVRTGAARAVKDAISRALALLPRDRFTSALEFAAALPAVSHQARASGRVEPSEDIRRLVLLVAAGIAVAGIVATALAH